MAPGDGMLRTIKPTLKRGTFVTAANWPVVAVQFVAESTFKILLGVPIVGGVLLVSLGMGQDVTGALGAGPRQIVTTVGARLAEHPLALTWFVLSCLAVILGGSALVFLVKGGTMTVLARGEAAAGPIERGALRLRDFRRAEAYSIAAFTAGSQHLFRRYLRLGAVLLLLYLVSGAFYLGAILGGYSLLESSGWVVGWTLVAALGSAGLFMWIALVNLVYLLVQMVVAVEDCSVRTAARIVVEFLRARGSNVMLVFAVVLVLVVAATAASLLATAGLGLISFVPLIGLAVFPLQAAAWLVRGLVFQFLGLTALTAYLSLYREHRAWQARGSSLVRTAS
ncbi:MAG: hypothetical protein KJ061_01925 [Vicinamibacteraceae bacterium]|nr:hypothetical protein [Vicinamibacteraceae bacterium]